MIANIVTFEDLKDYNYYPDVVMKSGAYLVSPFSCGSGFRG